MKRKIILIFIICLFMLGICAFGAKGTQKVHISKNNKNLVETSENQLPFNAYKAFSGRKDINEFINNNPIDADFNKNKLPQSTAEMVEFYGEYIDYWEAEMDNALLISKNGLGNDGLECLNTAQSNWSEYLKYDISTSNEIHIETAGIGSEMSILSSYKVLSKVRDRALELIEYCILFEGNYEFIF